MGKRHASPTRALALGILLLLLAFAPTGVAPAMNTQPLCLGYDLDAIVRPPGEIALRHVSLQLDPVGVPVEGTTRVLAACDSEQELELRTMVSPGEAFGFLALSGEDVQEAGSGVPALPEGEDQVVSFRIEFAIRWGGECEAPEGHATIAAQELNETYALPADAADPLCALLAGETRVDPVALLVEHVEDLLDLALEQAPWLSSSIAYATHALDVVTPEEIDVAGVRAAPNTDVLQLHAGDGQGYGASAGASGQASAGQAEVAVEAEVDTPHAETAPRVDGATGEPAPPAAAPTPAPTSSPAHAAATSRTQAREKPSPIASPTVPAPASPEWPRERSDPEPLAVVASAPPAPPSSEEGPARVAAVSIAARTTIERAGPDPAKASLVVAAGGALALVGFALYQRVQRPRALDHPGRAALYAAVEASPHALTAGELALLVYQQRKTAEYHLRYLARLGLLRTGRRDDGATIYHHPAAKPTSRPDPLGEALLGLVRARPGVTTAQAAAALSLTRPRAERRLRDLLVAGQLVAALDEGERKFFASDARLVT